MANTVIINCKTLLKPLYEYCLQEQISTFTYNVRDKVHINLTKHHSVLDTLLRMLKYFSQMMSELDANNILVVYDAADLPQIEPLPLSTLITNSTPKTTPTTKDAIFQSTSLLLTRFAPMLQDTDAPYLKSIETFIHKHGAHDKAYKGLMKTGTNNAREANDSVYDYRLSLAQKALGEVFLPIFMRLTTDEISSCLKLFVQIIATTSIKYNVKVVKFTTKTRSLNDLYIIAHQQFKHSSKIIFTFDHMKHTIPNHKSKVMAAKDCDNYTFNFKNLLLSKPITHNLNTYAQFTLHKHFTYKFTATYVIANKNVPVSPYVIIAFKQLYLCDYFRKLDAKYSNTIPCINPSSFAALNNFYMVYSTKTFKMPQTDTYEDSELMFCTYEGLKEALYGIIWKFNAEHPFRIRLDKYI